MENDYQKFGSFFIFKVAEILFSRIYLYFIADLRYNGKQSSISFVI